MRASSAVCHSGSVQRSSLPCSPGTCRQEEHQKHQKHQKHQEHQERQESERQRGRCTVRLASVDVVFLSRFTQAGVGFHAVLRHLESPAHGAHVVPVKYRSHRSEVMPPETDSLAGSHTTAHCGRARPQPLKLHRWLSSRHFISGRVASLRRLFVGTAPNSVLCSMNSI